MGFGVQLKSSGRTSPLRRAGVNDHVSRKQRTTATSAMEMRFNTTTRGARGFNFPEEILMLAHSAGEARVVNLDITSHGKSHDLTKPVPASIRAYFFFCLELLVQGLK